MILLAADYCQLELRILCELSRDKTLAKILNNSVFNSDNAIISYTACSTNNNDPFNKIAQYFNSYVDQNANKKKSFNNSQLISENINNNNQSTTCLFKCDRQKAKQLCYAIIYGMGAEKLSQEMHISKLNAQKLINQFFELFPSIIVIFCIFYFFILEVKSWINKRIMDSQRHNYCKTYMGRKRIFMSAAIGETLATENRIGRQCINYIIQVIFFYYLTCKNKIDFTNCKVIIIKGHIQFNKFYSLNCFFCPFF